MISSWVGRTTRSVVARKDTPSFARLFSSRADGPVVVDKQENGVCVVTLSNEAKLNPMTVLMGEAFEETMKDLATDDTLKACVLTGAGTAFSAGGDLQFLRDRTNDTPYNNTKIMRAFYRRFLSLRNLPIPVISALNGPAIGAGFCVALATDIRVTHPKCKLGLTFVGLGLHPGMAATHYLPRLVGHQTAARLLLTGDVISGQEASDLGLALLADDPLEHALSLAGRIAKQSPDAVQMCVRSLRNAQDDQIERSLWRDADCQAHNYATSVGEGLDALIEKRTPSW